MPGMNRTGPRGEGPMTGRGAGLCAGYGVPGSMQTGFGGWAVGGRGRGAGQRFGGGGRGWRHQYYATGQPGWARGYGPPIAFDPALRGGISATPGRRDAHAEEVASLDEQARHLRASLETIESRLALLRQEPDTQAESPKHEES